MRLPARRFVKSALIFALAIAAAFAAMGCGSSSDDESGTTSSSSNNGFRLGLEAPLSGEQAVLGKGMLKGAELAAAELNAKDGIMGKQVEVVPIDDAADPGTGVEAAEAAIEEGLDGVVGPYNSSVGEKTLPLYLDAGLVPVRLTSDNSTDGQGFTLQPMSDQIAPVASKALSDWLGAKRVAIAYDPTPGYTLTVSKAVKSSLESEGVDVVGYEKVKPGEDDYTDVIRKLEASNPDVIYSAVYFPEGGLIAKEMHEMGVSAKCVADYASYDTGFVETAGVAAARACPVVGVPAPGDFRGSKPLVASYEDEFGEEPGTWSPYTYDSVGFLADGIAEAGGTEKSALTKALGGVDGWKGWTGDVSIDAKTGNRDPATVVIVDTDAKGRLHVDESWAKAVGAPY
jgi:branched-chain amino acid transport system substrate-binding protein